MDLSRLVCWLLHRREWDILVPGLLPGQIDAVAFCPRCDKVKGRGVHVLRLQGGPSAGFCSAHS
jgi:hypothetical protein